MVTIRPLGELSVTSFLSRNLTCVLWNYGSCSQWLRYQWLHGLCEGGKTRLNKETIDLNIFAQWDVQTSGSGASSVHLHRQVG